MSRKTGMEGFAEAQQDPKGTSANNTAREKGKLKHQEEESLG